MAVARSGAWAWAAQSLSLDQGLGRGHCPGRRPGLGLPGRGQPSIPAGQPATPSFKPSMAKTVKGVL